MSFDCPVDYWWALFHFYTTFTIETLSKLSFYLSFRTKLKGRGFFLSIFSQCTYINQPFFALCSQNSLSYLYKGSPQSVNWTLVSRRSIGCSVPEFRWDFTLARQGGRAKKTNGCGPNRLAWMGLHSEEKQHKSLVWGKKGWCLNGEVQALERNVLPWIQRQQKLKRQSPSTRQWWRLKASLIPSFWVKRSPELLLSSNITRFPFNLTIKCKKLSLFCARCAYSTLVLAFTATLYSQSLQCSSAIEIHDKMEFDLLLGFINQQCSNSQVRKTVASLNTWQPIPAWHRWPRAVNHYTRYFRPYLISGMWKEDLCINKGNSRRQSPNTAA